jgi:hypothetical protein
MNSEVINLLREASNTFAKLAEAYEQEQKNDRARLYHIEQTACETKSTLQEVANLILTRL